MLINKYQIAIVRHSEHSSYQVVLKLSCILCSYFPDGWEIISTIPRVLTIEYKKFIQIKIVL